MPRSALVNSVNGKSQSSSHPVGKLLIFLFFYQGTYLLRSCQLLFVLESLFGRKNICDQRIQDCDVLGNEGQMFCFI